MNEEKEELRRELEKQVEEFLKKGGKIEQATTHRHAPKGMRWVAERGMDYTSSQGRKSIKWTEDPEWDDLPY